jgi:hypothetical protein
MDEFTTAAQEPDEAMQEPFEALADDIEEAIATFTTVYHDIDVLDVLKALNAVTTGFLHSYDDEDEDEDDEGEV